MATSGRAKIRTTEVSLGLVLLAIIFGGFGFLSTQQVMIITGVSGTEYAILIRPRALQFGFLLLAVAYIAYRGDVDQFVRVGVPDVEGIVWIIGIPIALIGISVVLDPALAAVGLERERDVRVGVDPTATVSLFLVFVVAWWIVGAPAEELLFRGVIQGRLRETFSAVPGVFLAALFFALFHVLIGPLNGLSLSGIIHNGIETFTGGLAFAAAYERTDNLIVPSVAHATLWTIPFVLPWV